MTSYDTGSVRADTGDRPQEAGLGELIGNIATNLSTLLRQEVELAKVELKRDATEIGKASGFLVGAAVAALFLILFLSLALMWTLGAYMPIGWATLIVAVLWGIAAAALGVVGRSKLQKVNPVPERTIETVKEDVEWLKTRNASSRT